MANISIIGLGKLGACMAAVYASKGHSVIGVDLNTDFVDCINAGRPPVEEPRLVETIALGKERLHATSDYADAITHSDITFIIVPTPTDESGKFTTTFVEKACESIGTLLAEKEVWHTVVLTSTVLPGDCEKTIIPILERTSGKQCGTDFGFCYSPEFIAIGSVVTDLLEPDFFLLGASDNTAEKELTAFYASVCNNNAPVRAMSIPSAELTKISLNSYVTMKITFANMLSEVAQHIPGVDIDDVTSALGHDKRIGKAYLRAGLGYGGPCFPRDNRAFAAMAAAYGVDVPYAQKTDEYNNSIVARMVSLITEHAGADKKVSILGTSYKPGTALSEESQAIAIAQMLVRKGYEVYMWNPAGNAHAKRLIGDTVTLCDGMSDCVAAADTIFVSNWDGAMAPLLQQELDGKTIIDPWRQFRSEKFSDTVVYIPYGAAL